MPKLKSILFLLFLFLNVSVSCWANKNDDMSQLLQLLSAIDSLSGRFKQSAAESQPGSALLQRSQSGQFYLLKPKRFHWQVESPDNQTLIADGRNLWIYDADLEQVTVQALASEVSELPLLLLTGDASALAQSYRLVKKEKQGTIESFTLQARDESNFIQGLTLIFEQSIINKIIMQESLGKSSTLQFTEVKQNIKLADDLFHFTVPKGVDVIGKALP